MRTIAIILFLSLASFATAAEIEPGQVSIPLDLYNQLVDASRLPIQQPLPAPAAYALGTATVDINVTDRGSSVSGELKVRLNIEVLEDGWVAVPILSAGTPVKSVTVGGKPVQLIATADGLTWGTKAKGSYTMDLVYRVDSSSFKDGFVLSAPVPPAAAINLTALLPGTNLDVAVIPSAAADTQISGSRTRVTATIPTTRGVLLSWRTPAKRGHTVGRVAYSGRLDGNAVTWTGVYQVEIFNDQSVTLPLMPRSVTLRDLKVDGKPAPIMLDGDHFSTPVKGLGRHTVEVGFQVAVKRGNGPPRVELPILEVPVSRFDLVLPGRKDVSVTPAANVTSRYRDNATTATVFVPLNRKISFSWAEAVPDAVKAEVRANAAVYHAVAAEEGVMSVRAMVVYQLTRGETSVIKLTVPPEVQVNRISSPSGAVADWRIAPVPRSSQRELSIFLDRKLKGEMLFEVDYDRSLAKTEQISVPMIRSADAQRQRGMVALLAGKDLTLKPIEDEGISRVGENQLPSFVRDAIEQTVAHTFKYVELPERLLVEAVPPERKHGRFDSQVDTLISLGEVTLRGAASVEINVKSGRVMDLELALPKGVNLLSLSGPSLRTHTVEASAEKQQILVHFTQQMEGQFRLELNYEWIMVDGDADVGVPRVTVIGADVEQGRLAIEALSAVEVQATATEQLQALEIAELPRQLLLRTTNPILLAYKYVRSESPIRLALKLTRHRVVEVQEAAIDSAHFTTLFTADGLAVTTAVFDVRNSRKQFLRLALPENSTVWSATVDGKPEKPAIGEGDEEGSVLIKIVTSTQGFPVRLIYATDGAKIRGLGAVKSKLPRPDILVTRSRWDVYLPDGMSYAQPRSNMKTVLSGTYESADEISRALAEGQDAGAVQAVEPLHISVPTSGLHYAFEKLYANQGDEDAWFSLAYASAGGARMGTAASLVATVMIWLGAWSLFAGGPLAGRRPAVACVAFGAIIMLASTMLYRVSLSPAIIASLLAGLAIGAYHGLKWWQSRQAELTTAPVE
ncbi:MAG: hypothetical protein GY906_15695 [bacterium]|nr:hypothetical protein [bacterium]